MASTRYDESKNVWFGPENKFQVDKQKVFGKFILEKLTEGSPDRVIQIDSDTGVALTACEIRTQTIRCAQNLLKFGCTQNDRIVVIARNHHHLTPLVLAALCIGTPIAPLDVFHVQDGLSIFLRRLEPSFVFCDTDALLTVKETAKEIGIDAKIYSVNGTVSGYENFKTLLQPTGCEDNFECLNIGDPYAHIAAISCSSGSTGTPKSVILSHALFAHLFLSRFTSTSFVSLSFSSLYWFSGLAGVISAVFAPKPRVFTAKPFSPELFIKLVSDYQIEFFIGPPSQLQAVLKSELCDNSKLKSLKLVLPIGSFLPKSLIDSLKTTIPTCLLMTAYGMTELGIGGSMTLLLRRYSHLWALA